jgi:hypothetical protein
LIEAAPAFSGARPRAAVVALVCAAIGAPLCLRLLFYYVADPGPGWLLPLVDQTAGGWLGGALDFGSAVGLALAVVGAVLGGVVLFTREERGEPTRQARVALYLGLADLAAVAAGVVAMYLFIMVNRAH